MGWWRDAFVGPTSDNRQLQEATTAGNSSAAALKASAVAIATETFLLRGAHGQYDEGRGHKPFLTDADTSEWGDWVSAEWVRLSPQARGYTDSYYDSSPLIDQAKVDAGVRQEALDNLQAFWPVQQLREDKNVPGRPSATAEKQLDELVYNANRALYLATSTDWEAEAASELTRWEQELAPDTENALGMTFPPEQMPRLREAARQLFERVTAHASRENPWRVQARAVSDVDTIAAIGQATHPEALFQALSAVALPVSVQTAPNPASTETPVTSRQQKISPAGTGLNPLGRTTVDTTTASPSLPPAALAAARAFHPGARTLTTGTSS